MKKLILTWCVFTCGVLTVLAESGTDILNKSGVKGGLIVHVGCGDGKLTSELGANEGYLVHGLDVDQKNVDAARKYIQKKDLYGKVSVDTFDGKHLPYADNLVNVVVVTSSKLQVTGEEIERVLAPRGVLMVKSEGKENLSTLYPLLSTQSPSGLKGWTKLTKPWPKEIDEWTHYLHGPDNNAVAKDTVIDVPRNLQWTQPPTWVANHNLHAAVSAMVTSGGRVFSIINEMPPAIKTLDDQWVLSARDAFNGLVLWKKPISEWGWKFWSTGEHGGSMRFKTPAQNARRLVAAGGKIFVTPGFFSPVHALDAVTGKDLKVFEGTEKTFEILFSEGVLLLAVNHALGTDKEKPDISVMCVNSETGDILWKQDGLHGVQSYPGNSHKLANIFLTVGSGKVYLVDRNEIVCLDMTKGNELWRAERFMKIDASGPSGNGKRGRYYPNDCTLLHSDGVVLFSEIKSDSPNNFTTKMDKTCQVSAYDSVSGKELWRIDSITWAYNEPPDLFVAQGLVWTLTGKNDDSLRYVGLELKTGKTIKSYPAGEIFRGSGHQRCFRNKATENLMMFSRRNTEFLNMKTGEITQQSWLKGMCRYGVMPANGMIYYPPHNCACNIFSKQTGFTAVTAVPYPKVKSKTTLVKGPSYGTINHQPLTINHSSWPMYRHDPERSGSISSVLSTKPSVKWEVALGGTLTQAIAVKDKVYTAAKNAHEMYCLNRGTGKTVWRYTAGGRIDSSPTYSNGRLIFGSRDGAVYCLNAETGFLIWRFQAAPFDVRIISYGQVESLWPVHGSLIVQKGKVYCLAGRSSNLNGGMSLNILDLKSGEVVQKRQIKGDVKSKWEVKGSVRSDLMTADGDRIYMRNIGFAAADINDLEYNNIGNHHVLNVVASGIRTGGGFLDTSWFNAANWTYASWKGQALSLDQNHLFGVCGNRRFGQSFGHDPFVPGQTGYLLFCKTLSEKDKLATRNNSQNRGDRSKYDWSVEIPLRGQALLVADTAIYVAGTKDVVDKSDSWGHIEGRFGGILAVYSREDGKKLSELAVSAAPIVDGLSACGNNLFLVTKSGTIICYE
ncbi:PQQ-binding-like beta-propeller repeat protein [Verrucomicrobiota bacterium]